MDEFIKQNVQSIIAIGTTVIAIITGLLAIQRWFHVQKCERMDDHHKSEIVSIKNQHEIENLNKEKQLSEERKKIKSDLKDEFEQKKNERLVENQKALIQEIKLAYIKYIYIRRNASEPVYRKYVKRLGETIEVRSEYQYYRFNKFSNSNNEITFIDRSTGIVDPKILFPWRQLTFTDVPSKKSKGMLTQDISGSDTYLSVTTYYNGFKEGEEDIGIKVEMDTNITRVIADFSSIVWLPNLFIREPDAYKMELNGSRTKLLGLEKIDDGIYHLESFNMKKGESLLIDFHVNWNFLHDSDLI
jgi:hypothetical protein